MKLHFIHDWTEWEVMKSNNGKVGWVSVFEKASDTKPVYRYFMQQKYCKICKKLKIRKIKSS